MNSRKITSLALVGLGALVFNGFTPINLNVGNEIVASANKDKLEDLVTVNKKAPVQIKYGTENPIKEILSAIDVSYKQNHEEIQSVGVSEIYKLKYTTTNSEIYLSGYDPKDFSMKEVTVEIRTKNLIESDSDIKKFTVLVKLIDTDAPVIEIENNSIEITEGDDFNPYDNILSVTDREEGNIDYTVSGDYTTSEAGTYPIEIVATDKSGNTSTRTFDLVVKEKVVVPTYQAVSYTGRYSYDISGSSFIAPDPNHRASMNGAEPGNCTWYVYNRLDQLGAPIPYRTMGNGGEWAANAQRYGYTVNKTAKAGSVWSTQNGYYGHVAFVEKVNADGSIEISEMNRHGLFSLTTRTVSPSEAATGYYIDFGL